MAEEKNYIRCRVILEVLGKPKSHVEKSIRTYVDKIKESSEWMVLKEDFAEPKPQESMWSSFVDLEVVFHDVKSLLPFCFDYMPSSMEIVKPESIMLKSNDFSDFLNDLQSRLHHVDMIAKKLTAEKVVLQKNLNTSIKNVLLLFLGVRKGADLGEIAKAAGMSPEGVSPFIEQLVKDGKIKKEANGYILQDAH